MARCDIGSARKAGVSCLEFDRLQTQVADQVRVFRADLQSLGAALHGRGALSRHDKLTSARFDKYMGKGTASTYANIALTNNILMNAERELRSTLVRTEFDSRMGAGGETKPSSMILGNILNTNTILHEAVHFGTKPWRSGGSVLPVLDRGIIGSFQTYGTLRAA